ncbi:uncharacterized protein N7515_002010 [Penicillium bovifimosum]|uniref:Xylanolytic transcriptional activator regulatory domain-containing protein n=1 Tax=Penicillium bovifimosum TaxID=126998 RepID=A0A9W9L8V0_9EURO|nr:uncharacterized protein N7515_002010 [Penicillium bovifimosum]KAJ5143223.1 hypothetical protein N7515_002010 [Penicillium bovifimosum]
MKWREREKRHIGNLHEKAQDYEAMLKELEGLIHGKSADRVRELLEKYDSKSGDSSNGRSHNGFQGQAESERSSSPSGSLEGIDQVEDDLNSSANLRATGFMGKSSDITWMRRLREETEQRGKGQPPESKFEDQSRNDRIPPHLTNYHIDDLGIDAPGPVQMYWVPPRAVADNLFEIYLHWIHPHFPIIDRSLFVIQYGDFYNDVLYPGDKWMAILNMIFAIATNYLCNSDGTSQLTHSEHLFFLARARMLSMGGDSIFQHPDLQQVQIEGLIAFHMLSTNQINRAWRISALAVRSAISLGLNKKINASNINAHSLEIRCRVWWCLFAVEHRLGSMTGRPASISIHMYSTQLPLPLEEEQFSEPSAMSIFNNSEARNMRLDMAMTSPHLRQSDRQRTQDTLVGRSWLQSLPVTPSLFFLYHSDLTVVNQEILNRVYTPENAMASWEDIKSRIRQLKDVVETWFSTLPSGLNFTSMKNEDGQTYWAKTNLAFLYHSTRILLGRPALCRRTTHGKSSDLDEFSNDMSVITLESAMHMLDLLPDEPNTLHAYRFCPWWCLLHYIMQTATVIILELSFDCFHMPGRRNDLLQCAGKSVRWLQTLSEHCIASRRAWQLCETALGQILSNTGSDAQDVPPPDQQRHDISVDPSTFVSPAYLNTTNVQNPPHEAQMVNQRSNSLDITNSLASASLSVPGMQGNSVDDAYFPQDPISGDFIRYIFPELNVEDRLPSGGQSS